MDAGASGGSETMTPAQMCDGRNGSRTTEQEGLQEPPARVVVRLGDSYMSCVVVVTRPPFYGVCKRLYNIVTM